MNCIIKGRRMGKTFEICQIMKNMDAMLLVNSEKERKQVEKDYCWMKGKVYSWKNLKSMKLHKPVFIDNVDIFLQECFRGVEIIGFSVTGINKWDEEFKRLTEESQKRWKALSKKLKT